VLATYLVSSRLTPIYEATAKIDVDRRIPSGVIGQEATQGSTATMGRVHGDPDGAHSIRRGAKAGGGTFQAARERKPACKIGRGERAQESGRAGFSKVSENHRPISTYLLDISYRSTDPHLAANVANAIAQSFLQHTFEIRVKASGALSESW